MMGGNRETSQSTPTQGEFDENYTIQIELPNSGTFGGG